MLDAAVPLWYNMNMKNWNSSTVPCSVEERHELSLSLGKAFAQSYKLHPLCEFTVNLLEMYRESRRMVERPYAGTGRYGSFDAWYATQG